MICILDRKMQIEFENTLKKQIIDEEVAKKSNGSYSILTLTQLHHVLLNIMTF